MADHAQFESVLRAVEPAVRLVPERHLRKLLHYLRDHGRIIPRNPRRPLWVSREDLAAADVTPRTIYTGTEDPLLLVTTPDDRSIERMPEREQLREYWQLLFEAAVIAKLEKLHEKSCESRLASLGPAAVREVRFVLEAEHFADPDADDVSVYRMFAASYLVLNAFAPHLLTDFFPSLPPREKLLPQIGQDVDWAELLARTRPVGAAEAVEPARSHAAKEVAATVESAGRESLLAQARDAEGTGNFVRAAILQQKAGAVAGSLDALVQGLAGVLQWNAATCEVWRHALAVLIAPAASGDWPRAARCLYELQKIPADLKNDVFAVDLVEPIRTLGKRPVKRPLPHARDVMLLLKLRAARTHLHKSGLDPHVQHELDDLFAVEMHRLEAAIRTKLAPIIAAAITESGLVPANRVETVARDKIVAELLDRVCERGQLRFGNLRDAVARNQLKMPDLRGPGEFVGGDPLLRADTRLAYDLDGIYRRGEFYLRSLQRGSSLFFGTRSGRWLFLYLIAPFLAAFLTLTFAIELKHIGAKIYGFASQTLAPRKPPTASQLAAITGESVFYTWDEGDNLVWFLPNEYEWDDHGNLVWIDHELEYEWDDDGNIVFFDLKAFADVAKETFTATKPVEAHESPLPPWEPVFVFGVFLLLMFHAPPFRRAFLSVARGLLLALWSVVWDMPKRILQSRIVVAVRYSPPARFFVRYLFAPLIVAVIVVLFLAFLGASSNRLLRWGGLVLGAAFVALNTPWGWSVQERIAESVSDGWRVLRVNLIPGIVAAVLEWFRRLANWVERRLYAVDEWLRFRGGDSGGSLAAKAILGLFWFPFAYLARFSFYLLMEPQVNPVKHFPVVTVSHKVLLPLTPSLADALNVATGTAFWLLACVPGIFGFIAWELLSNWKLYAANRADTLKPATIGSHGETMRGLLRPGFHSGTVPKIFRKLRRADIRHDRHAASHLHHEVHHVEEGVSRFVERELIALLEQFPEWGGCEVRLGRVSFGCQRTVIELECGDGDPLRIAFENRAGRIAATVESAGWTGRLDETRRDAMSAALGGLFDMAAAETADDLDRSPERWSEWTRRWG
ncbi:MAG: hypothetical protein U0791_07355 [Gemmataceae bacterium]